MVAVLGLHGLRPAPAHAARVTSPPYDVIKPGSRLEALLAKDPASLYHVILGEDPVGAVARMEREGFFVPDDEPCFYVYEQTWNGEERTGVFVATEVTPYSEHEIIRHEKTFDEKVKGRVALANATGYTFGPVFFLTRARLGSVLEATKEGTPLYEMTSDFGGLNDLSGVRSRVFRVPEKSAHGQAIRAALAPHPFYIADGHHRYHAALLNGLTHALSYVTEHARIQAYDRVVNGVKKLAEVKHELALEPVPTLRTPEKHAFCLYTREGAYVLRAREVPDDVVGRLDCAILERELYPKLGLTHAMISDPARFDYYPESALDEMKAVVDRGDYDLAIALHPVSIDELMAVADAGLENADVVMPEKSTFFAPKILSGIVAYRHTKR
jgi:uncharacterized protein (DUF1015 family)